MGVVEVSLVVIVKDLVRLFRLLEAHFGLFALAFRNLVWVMCESLGVV
jgi:hypothetical protein